MEASYDWVDDPSVCKVGVAGCITVVTGSSCDDILVAFGGDPTTFPEPWEYSWDSEDPTVAVVAFAGAVVAVEDNGFQGSRPEVLRSASSSGRAASVFWNVDRNMRVGLAEGGRVLCQFDPHDPGQRWGEDPGVAETLVADLPDDDDPVGLGMLVVERFTGVAVTRQLVSGLERVHILIPLLEDHRPARSEYHSLRGIDDALVGRIAALAEAEHRALAGWVAGEAADASGLDELPAVRDAVSAVAAHAAVQVTPDLQVLIRQTIADGSRTKDQGPWLYSGPGIASHRDVGSETRKGWRRAAAAKTIWAAANPDALAAALDAVYWARLAFPHDGPDFLDNVGNRLA
jgi:Family of unknown function (DUF6461)